MRFDIYFEWLEACNRAVSSWNDSSARNFANSALLDLLAMIPTISNLSRRGQGSALNDTLQSEESFAEIFKDAERTKLDRYVGAVRSTSVSLEEKLKDVIRQKRLSAARREETPPQYRNMVNAYYEALAKDGD